MFEHKNLHLYWDDGTEMIIPDVVSTQDLGRDLLVETLAGYRLVEKPISSYCEWPVKQFTRSVIIPINRMEVEIHAGSK